MSTTKVFNCTCHNEQQDEIHGDNKRLFNMTEKPAAQGKRVWRCTVCNKEVQR